MALGRPDGQGHVGQEELERIAEAIGATHERVCTMLGVDGSEASSVHVTKEQLEAAKHSEHGASLAEVWFDQQELPLLAPEVGCLDFLCAC